VKSLIVTLPAAEATVIDGIIAKVVCNNNKTSKTKAEIYFFINTPQTIYYYTQGKKLSADVVI
jgi:hypothetical protein